jgi:uncharacterized protein YcbK (DUF882 family)
VFFDSAGLSESTMKESRTNHVRLSVLLGVMLTLSALSSQGMSVSDSRELSFYHTHTGKRLDVVYWEDGDYVDSGLASINRFLSDFRTGDRVEMDPELLDLIYDVRASLGSDATYQVISAYRSPKTNEMLRNRSASSGVAKKSQHVLGRAIDVRLEGVATPALRDAAIRLQRGGVGYYAKSDFVHMDTGRVRRW